MSNKKSDGKLSFKSKVNLKAHKRKKNKNNKNNNKNSDSLNGNHCKKINGVPRQRLTLGQRLADVITLFAGSWTFIIIFFSFLALWMLVNLAVMIKHWDPYPFILLNLVLSCLAAVQAPVILMSQNRAAERDRHKAEMDYIVNRKAEREVTNMQRDLDEIKNMIKFVHKVYKDGIKKNKRKMR